VGVLVVMIGPIAVWRMVLRPLVRLDGTSVTVVNGVRTVTLGLGRIQPDVEADYYGLLIRYSDGARTKTVIASAVRKANLFVMMRKRRRSDEAADEISRAVRDYRLGG
jgi:hypothetical protein